MALKHLSSCRSLYILVAIVCLVGVGYSPSGVTGEVYTSLVTLRSLIENQEVLLDNLENYIEAEKERLQQLQSMMNECKPGEFIHQDCIHTSCRPFGNVLTVRLVDAKREVARKHVNNPDNAQAIVQHPISAYALVCNWSLITDKVYDDSSTKDLEDNNNKDGVTLPTTADRKGALMSLVRLQRTYNLSIDDMMTGLVRGHNSNISLGGRDLFGIGMAAMEKNLMDEAITWLKQTIRHRPADLPLHGLLYSIGMAFNYTEEYGKAEEYLELACSLDKNNSQYRKSFENVAEMAASVADTLGNDTADSDPQHKFKTYEALCRGEIPEASFPTSDVWCAYHTHIMPYVSYKMEVLSPDPWIVMYHDVITDPEVELLIEIAKEKLQRAKVGAHVETNIRISKLGWLYDPNDKGIWYLSKKVQHISGLSTRFRMRRTDAEPFQVVNYGIGGQYEPHLDALVNQTLLEDLAGPMFKGTGDRVATVLFYLSDVAEGGYTVFPSLKLYLPPVKFSAVFWYNLHRNGTADTRTQHAGCPVLVGEKWVANKWIRERGQLHHHRCGPHEMSTELQCQALYL